MYITTQDMESVPTDPEVAFVELEALARRRWEEEFENRDEEGSVMLSMRKYLISVLPVAEHYGIDPIASWERPPVTANYPIYEQFMDDVAFCVMELKLRIHSRVNEYSTALDVATKTKLRHLLDKVRDAVQRADIPTQKKDRLFDCINTMQAEIDRERTRVEAAGRLWIEMCTFAGKGVNELEPVWDAIERIGAALGLAKQTEDANPKLPPRREPKRIDPPRKQKNGFDKELDDEIPF